MNIGPVTDKQLQARRARQAAAALVIATTKEKLAIASEMRQDAVQAEQAEYEGMIGTIAANAIERVLGPPMTPSDEQLREGPGPGDNYDGAGPGHGY